MRRHRASLYRRCGIPAAHRIITLVVLLQATPLFAQFEFPAMSGSSAAMGGISVAINDPPSAFSSIAGLANLPSSNILLSVKQNLMSKGLTWAALATSSPLAFGGYSVSLLYFGDADYNEEMVTAAYALPLGETLSLGAAIHYLHSSTSDPYYDPYHQLTFSLAMRYAPAEKLTMTFRAYNPLAVVTDDLQGVHTPAIFTLGASYLINKELLMAAEVEKNLFYEATVRLGFQYLFLENYFLRAGISTTPMLYSFGLGAKWEHLGADLAFQFSTPLGTTPLLSVYYTF